MRSWGIVGITPIYSLSLGIKWRGQVGTSIPEIAASLFAAYEGRGGIVTGTNVGANIANLGLLIGIAAIIKPFKTDRIMLEKDGYIMLFSALLFYAFIINGVVGLYEGVVLFIFYIVYVLFLFSEKPKLRGYYGFRVFVDYFFSMEYIPETRGRVIKGIRGRKEARRLLTKEILKNLAIILASGVAIFFGADYLIKEAVYFAEYFHVPGNIIGLTVLALGTSFPELSVTISAAKKGFGNILVGNIMGSYIARMFLIIGISPMINPVSVEASTIFYTGPFMILMTLILLLFVKSDWGMSKKEGSTLLILYFGFMAWLLATV